MKALILAAGYGRRLQPLTNEIPKCMVEINGTPLLMNALQSLSAIDVTEIGIVVGHKAEYIKSKIGNFFGEKRIPIHFFENSKYLETNNIYSLYKAIDFCDDEMMLLEADLFYNAKLLSELTKSDADCTILVSKFNKDRMDGTIVRSDDDSAVTELVLGKWQDEKFDYSTANKTVNLYKFSKQFMQKYIQLIKWYVENVGTDSYYEKLLGSMIYLRDFDIKMVSVSENAWYEIDDIDDLNFVKSIFEKNRN